MHKTLLAGIGSVGAAALASLCCAGPLLFVMFGVGAGVASTFEPLRPFFTILTVLGIGIGFYLVYGRQRARAAAGDSAPGSACAVPRSRTGEKLLLWSATIIALVIWSFPIWSTILA